MVIGPGSLFTSLAATLVVPGMAAGLNASPGRLVYVCNLTTQDGETLGLDGAAHVRALCAGHRACGPPTWSWPTTPPSGCPLRWRRCAADRGEIESLGAQLETAGLVDGAAPWPQHDAARLGAVLRRLA